MLGEEQRYSKHDEIKKPPRAWPDEKSRVMRLN
jgi:hypothetical protein